MKTPLNHCSSSMMHSEAWNEMRKNNSPNTIGNEAGIAHNKKMREAIGTFKMPHSPLNKSNEVKKDSLGKEDAWAKWEKGYMDRKYKFKGTPYEKPITREENIREMESERSEFMYDPKIGKIRLRKTDDADIAIERKSSNGKDGLAPYKSISDIQKTYDDNMAYAKNQLNKGKLSQKNYDSFVGYNSQLIRHGRQKRKTIKKKEFVIKTANDIARKLEIYGNYKSLSDLLGAKKAWITIYANQNGLDSDKVLKKIGNRLKKYGLNAA